MEWSLGSFGDLRVDNAGCEILKQMAVRKTVCLRRLGGSRDGELRAGRFFANTKVTAAKLVAGWSERTGAACAARHVVAIQDTTEVKFPTTAQRRRGLGPVKKGNAFGLLVHAMVAPAFAGAGYRCRNRVVPWVGRRRCLEPRRGEPYAASQALLRGPRIGALGGYGATGKAGTGGCCDGNRGGRPRCGYLPRVGGSARHPCAFSDPGDVEPLAQRRRLAVRRRRRFPGGGAA